MATDQNKAIVNRLFDEFCNARKLDIAGELFTADHVYHDPQIPADKGPEGMKPVVSTYQNAFPDAHWHVDEVIESDNNITVRWRGTGTHVNDLNGIPPTGKKLEVNGLWVFRFKDGKIAESWNVWDTLGLLQQIGAVPKMEAAMA